MFRTEIITAKDWHTRCARWCKNDNFDNILDNQSWQPILTTSLDYQPWLSLITVVWNGYITILLNQVEYYISNHGWVKQKTGWFTGYGLLMKHFVSWTRARQGTGIFSKQNVKIFGRLLNVQCSCQATQVMTIQISEYPFLLVSPRVW